MNRHLFYIVAATGAFAASPSSAAVGCAQLTGSGIVGLSSYDPLGTAVVRENFQLEFSKPTGQPGGIFYIQFIDTDDGAGATHVGSAGPGPYEITAVNRTDSLVTGNAILPPMTMADGDGWLRLTLDDNGPAVANLRLGIREGLVPAGVYREDLDIRIACPNGGGFDYDTLSSAVEVQIGVDNTLRVDATDTPNIPLGDLASTGPAVVRGIDIPLRAVGPFNISFASENSAGGDANSSVGLLVRSGATSGDANSRIPYAVRIDQVEVSNRTNEVRCASRTSPLRIDVVTPPAPAAGKRAGDYQDMLEVTLTPNLDGPGATAGCALLR